MGTFERRRRRALVVAAVVAVTAVVVLVQYARPEAPVPVASRADAPPDGVQVIYLRDSSHRHALVAYDWSGNRRGSVQLPTWVDTSRLQQAPDGSGLMLAPGSADDYVAYFDRFGGTIDEFQEPNVAEVWADDSRHLCVLADGSPDGVLVTRLPGHPDRKANSGVNADSGWVACSIRNDRAILQSPDFGAYVAKLSTGAVTAHLDWAAGHGVVASADADYLAIGNDVYRATDLAVSVGQIDPSLTPLAFSADHKHLLVDLLSGQALEVIDWQTGAVAWRQDLFGSKYGPWLVRPSGADFAVASPLGIEIVHADGSTSVLPPNAPAW